MDAKRRANVPLRLTNVRFKTTMHNCVAFKVMLARAWVEVFEDSDWDIFWYYVAFSHIFWHLFV